MISKRRVKKKTRRLKKSVKIIFFLFLFFLIGLAFYHAYSFTHPYVSIVSLIDNSTDIIYNAQTRSFYKEGHVPVRNTIFLLTKKNGSTYTLRSDEDGNLYTGWYEENGSLYYYDENGEILTSSTTIDGQDYVIAGDGHFLNNEWYEDNWYMDGVAIGTEHDTLLFIEGETGFYYLSSENDGKPLTDASATLEDGRVVHFDDYGNIVSEESHDDNGYYFPVVEAFETSDITKDVPVSVYSRDHGTTSSYRLINHRGYHESAPENTLLAFQESVVNGYQYVETDVQFTADGIPVLSHNTTINATARNMDGSIISETIEICSHTYEKLWNYDFGISRGSQYSGTKITTFEEFISWCFANQIHPYIELKDTCNTDEKIQKLVDIVNQYNMLDSVTWISFQKDALKILSNHISNTRIGYLTRSDEEVSTVIGFLTELRNAGNDVFVDCVLSDQEKYLSECKANDIPIELWTINSTLSLNTIDSYVTGITTDTIMPE